MTEDPMGPLTEVRLAFRSLRRRPAFTALAVVTLALGIGATTAVFSIVDAVLLRSLPYRDAGNLVVVFADGGARGQGRRLATTAGDFLDWREQAAGFSGLAAVRNESRRITGLDAPVVPLVHAVTANYFDVLGAQPLLGRVFAAGEDEPGRDDVVILSYGLWQSAFGGDAGIVGRRIALDGRQHAVIGIMRPEFYSAHLFATQPGLWVPTPIAALRGERATRDLLVYGRLAGGGSATSAEAALQAVALRLAELHPDTNDGWGVAVVGLRAHAVGGFTRTGVILLSAVALVLLMACANVANLTLARATERRRDVALRTALGANRSRIAGHLLAENLVLSLVSGALGAGLAFLAARPLARLVPAQANVPFLDRVAVDGRVLAFALVLALVTGLLFGLAPLRHALRLELTASLGDGGRGSVRAPGGRLRDVLIVGEVALAVVIAAGALLMLRTISGLERVAPGFDAERVLKLRTSLRGEEFRSPGARIAHFQELKRRLEAVPGIASASAVAFEPPPVAGGLFGAVKLSLPDGARRAEAPSAVARVVLADYFETMGIPIVAGRGVSADDVAEGRRVAVISRSLAARHFPGVDPLGRRFAIDGPRPEPMEIVGISGDVITGGGDPAPQPTFYTPYSLNPLAVMSVVMRVPEGDPRAPAHAAERIAWSLAPGVNVYAVETLDRRLADLNWRARLAARALGGFAALALALGAAGIYAVISHAVLQRRQEIGVRMALGARPSAVLGMVLGSGLRLASIGIVAGSLAALVLVRGLAGFLYGVAPHDPLTFATVGLLLLAVAALACLAPALRASRVDPVVALRQS